MIALKQLDGCIKCMERKYARFPVPGAGPLDAKIAFIGRNPGEQEDAGGRPFLGPAGTCFLLGLSKCGLKKENVYVTNAVKCYTPSGTSPSLFCQKMCRDTWLWNELAELANLKLIVTMGTEALHVFNATAKVTDLAGTHWNVKTSWKPDLLPVTVFCNYHPGAGLHNPEYGKKFFDNMVSLKSLLKEMEL